MTQDKDSTRQYPAAWQAGMGIIMKKTLSQVGIKLHLGSLCSTLGVGRATAYEAKNHIDMKLFQKPQEPGIIKQLKKDNEKANQKIHELNFVNEVLEYRIEHPNAYKPGERPYYSEDYKKLILVLRRKYGFNFPKISDLIKIPEDTLKNFSKMKDVLLLDGKITKLPENVISLINQYLRSKSKKSVKEFCNKNPDLLKDIGMNYQQVLSWFTRLGFVNTKGIFLNNTGLDHIIRFRPNSIWGTDGKNMLIIINGQKFRWVWQCLVDFKTTVIVGGLIGQAETTDNLLEAIRASKEKSGVTPLAIVLDNRLSENLPAIKEFLDQHEIEIIKTYPYNAKSNGIAEGNFSVFERWVGGTVSINGDDPESLSRSIAQMIVEIFTQMRNHVPRKALSMKTPSEIMAESKDNPPSQKEIEMMKEKIKALANRLKKEQKIPVISTCKQAAIDLAIKEVSPKHPETFVNRLSLPVYTHSLILQAIAIFAARRQEKPQEDYDHTYFGGILRNLANNKAVENLHTNLDDIFFHKFPNMIKKMEKEIGHSLQIDPAQTLIDLAKDYLQMPVPVWGNMILLQLKELFFLAASKSALSPEILCLTISKKITTWKYEERKKRELLLCRLFEWANVVKLYGYG